MTNNIRSKNVQDDESLQDFLDEVMNATDDEITQQLLAYGDEPEKVTRDMRAMIQRKLDQYAPRPVEGGAAPVSAALRNIWSGLLRAGFRPLKPAVGVALEDTSSASKVVGYETRLDELSPALLGSDAKCIGATVFRIAGLWSSDEGITLLSLSYVDPSEEASEVAMRVTLSDHDGARETYFLTHETPVRTIEKPRFCGRIGDLNVEITIS